MANKAKSLYLTDRTMSALRPGDALSGRMNQIVDRYLQIIESMSEPIRSQFSADSWSELRTRWRDRNAPDGDMTWLVDLEDERSDLGATIEDMSCGDLMIVAEMLERDAIEYTLATHS